MRCLADIPVGESELLLNIGFVLRIPLVLLNGPVVVL